MSFDPNTINLVKPTDKALIGTLINDDAFLVFRGDSNSFTTYRFNYQSLVALIQTFIPDITVIDSLSSISTLNALSAAQGTVLKGLVDDLITVVDNKLDASAYNNYFKGTFTSLVALQTALPTGSVGEYATVDTSGENSVLYIWDATENDWVMSISISSYNTDTIMEGSTNLYFTNQRAIGAFTRQNVHVSEATFLTTGQSFTGTLVMSPQYRVLQITTTAPMRVRLYTTLSKRDDDLSRTIGTPIPEGSGLMMEFVSSAGLLSADLTPIVDGFSSTENIPYSVVSTDAGGCNVDFTLNFVKTGV
jgi:hypothetical protein